MHDTTVQHVRQPDVLHIGRTARHLGGDVEPMDRLADNRVLGGRLRPGLGGGFALEVGLGGELAIADFAAVGRAHDAVGSLERIGADAEFPGGEVDQNRAHLGARHAQRRAAVLDRLAAGGLAFVRRAAGIGRDHGDLPERHIELFGRDLGKRGQDALPELDLAGKHRHLAVRTDSDPGIEHPVGVEAARELRPVFLLLGERGLGAQAEGDDDAAKAGSEVAPCQTGSVHVRSSRSPAPRASPRG